MKHFAKAIANHLKKHIYPLIFIVLFVALFIYGHRFVKNNYSMSIDESAFGPLDTSMIGGLIREIKQSIKERVVKAGFEEHLDSVDSLLDALFDPFRIRISHD